jgi:hypothetical protein
VSDQPPPGESLQRIPSLDPESEAEVALSRDNNKATQEAIGFSQGDLEERSKQNEHRRTETFRNNIHWIFVVGMWATCLMLLGGAGVLGWHFVAPERLCWLTPDQMKILTAIVSSGAVTGTANKYMSRRIT